MKTTSTDIISIKERRIGVIDGPISRRWFDYFDEYKNFTSENDEYSMNTHSAIVSSIIKDIYLPSKLYVTQVECGGVMTRRIYGESFRMASYRQKN